RDFHVTGVQTCALPISARNIPWGKAVADDGTYRPLDELNGLYRDGASLKDGDDVIAYCRIGERSAHTWFALTHLLGFKNVRNYEIGRASCRERVWVTWR